MEGGGAGRGLNLFSLPGLSTLYSENSRWIYTGKHIHSPSIQQAQSCPRYFVYYIKLSKRSSAPPPALSAALLGGEGTADATTTTPGVAAAAGGSGHCCR
jgi:hypothetical protein